MKFYGQIREEQKSVTKSLANKAFDASKRANLGGSAAGHRAAARAHDAAERALEANDESPGMHGSMAARHRLAAQNARGGASGGGASGS